MTEFGAPAVKFVRIAVWSLCLALLLLPLIAMRFTDEVHWSLADFVLAGLLMLTTGLVFERAAKLHDGAYRAGAAVALAAAFMLVWSNLAVGNATSQARRWLACRVGWASRPVSS
ncbi:MAG TPA: hypothetical protein VFQ57_00720 [Sphingomonas sp.]|jgi:hypothetical protein|nr:hypothetical protein [Sphingomonas sp.]